MVHQVNSSQQTAFKKGARVWYNFVFNLFQGQNMIMETIQGMEILPPALYLLIYGGEIKHHHGSLPPKPVSYMNI